MLEEGEKIVGMVVQISRDIIMSTYILLKN